MTHSPISSAAFAGFLFREPGSKQHSVGGGRWAKLQCGARGSMRTAAVLLAALAALAAVTARKADASLGGVKVGESDPEEGDGGKCSQHRDCATCTDASCFWQDEAGGVCDEECSIMDVSCWGKTAEWEAHCPSVLAKAQQVEEEPCCDRLPSCDTDMDESISKPCTQPEMMEGTCFEKTVCCNVAWCRVKSDVLDQTDEVRVRIGRRYRVSPVDILCVAFYTLALATCWRLLAPGFKALFPK